MKIDNGRLARLEIEGVFDGAAGVSGRYLSFIPNRFTKRPGDARFAALDGNPIALIATKDADGQFWTAEWRAFV